MVIALLLSLLLYWILQSRDDEKAMQEGREKATTAKRIMLFFFLLVVTTCLCFFVGNAFKSNDVSGMSFGGDDELSDVKLSPNYKSTMIRNIHEDVLTGLPPRHSYDFE